MSLDPVRRSASIAVVRGYNMANDQQMRLLISKTIKSLQKEVDRLKLDNYQLRKENNRLTDQCNSKSEPFRD